MTTILMTAGFAAGVALGLFFFGGLWLTITRLHSVRYPAILALASFWIRASAVVGVVFLFVRRGWQYGLALLAGFIVGRLATSILLPERRPTSKCT